MTFLRIMYQPFIGQQTTDIYFFLGSILKETHV